MAASPGARKGPDLTTGPIGKTLIAFALPLLGTNVLQSINGSTNAIWVSHVLGERALAAISNGNQIFFLMVGATFGLTMAANIMIGQAIGADDEALARRVVGTATSFFLVFGAALGLAGILLTPAILSAMGTPLDARADAEAYLRVVFAALPFLCYFTLLMMALRGTGDTRTPFLFTLGTVALNLILNPLLILGWGPLPAFGIAGSAGATLAAEMLTLVALMAHLYRKNSLLMLRRADWALLKPDPAVLRPMVLKGVPMAFQMAVISLAATTMLSLVNAYGSVTTAAYGAASQVWTYVQMPAMALGAAISTMVAQNVGAGRMDRVEQIARTGVLYGFGVSVVLVVLVWLADPLILRAFLPADSEALPIATRINTIVLWGFIAFGTAFIFNGIVRATGAVWAPLAGMVIALWGVRVPFAALLEDRYGADAIWFSMPVGALVMLILSAAYFQFGGWRKSRMIETEPKGETPDTGLATPAVDDAEAAPAR